MKKLIISIVVIVIILLGICLAISNNHNKSSGLQNVTVSQAFQVFLYAPLYVAQREGYFTQQGLNVNIVTAGGDDQAFASLVGGSAQFAVGDPTFAAVAGEKGQPGEVVGALLNGVPFWGIAQNKNIPIITTPSQLGSYKVATYPAPNTAYALQEQMFQNGGIKPNILQGAPGTLIPTVQKGSADIALELEPDVSTAVASDGFHIVYSLSQYYPGFAITGITVLPSYVQSEPNTVQKFINAIQEADVFIRNNPARAATILAGQFDVTPAIAISALENIVNVNVIPPNLMTSQNGWNAAIQLRKNTGDITSNAPYATYINNSFAENASSTYAQ